jgi:acyl carrier protein
MASGRTDATAIEDAIGRFIADDLLLGSGGAKLDPQEPLISGGLVDSLALVQLIVFLEEAFQITVRDGEVVPENFQTIRRIAALVAERRSQ